LKKPTGSVWFWFFKPGTGKTEPNRTGKKPSQTEPNRKNRVKPKKPSQTGKNRAKPSQTEKTEPNQFEPVFSLKNRTDRNRSV
jgi:hypothetical protein